MSSKLQVNVEDDANTIAGVREFLGGLPKDEVLALLKTTTMSIITTNDTKEAIDNIINYSDAVSILNRKRVKKDYLIKYLISKKVKIVSNADKSRLCRLVLDQWKYAEKDKLKELKFSDDYKKKPKPAVEGEKKESKTEVKEIECKEPKPAVEGEKKESKTEVKEIECKESKPVVEGEKKESKTEVKEIECKEPKPSISTVHLSENVPKRQIKSIEDWLIKKPREAENAKQNVPIVLKDVRSEEVKEEGAKQVFPLRTYIPAGTQTSPVKVVALLEDEELKNTITDIEEEEPMEYEECVILRQKEFQIGQALGEQFAKWFYDRLNSLNDFTAEHFWPECNLRIECISRNVIIGNTRNVQEVLHDGSKCFREMASLRIDRKLIFVPNLLAGGIRGKINPHGLAQIMVCGQLYLESGIESFGVYEQVFGLMKDPRVENNFKIKFSILRLREASYISKSPPALCDSSLSGLIDEIDEDDAEEDVHQMALVCRQSLD